MSSSQAKFSGLAAARVEQDSNFRLLVESVKDYAIFMLDPDGRVVTWNEGAQHIKGYRPDEIIGKHFSHFYTVEARERGWPNYELQVAAAEGKFIDEGWRVRKDGTTFWAYVVITALHDSAGKLCGFAKVTRDLTQQREREEKIRQLNAELHHLSMRLLQLQDEERRRVARELHDALGQELTALKMTLRSCRHDQERLPAAVEEAIGIADSAIKSVRNISYLLHPPLLDEMGLISALHWFMEGMQKRSEIQIQLIVKPAEFPRLPRDLETAIFRVVQEALTNVYRHSGSSTARIEVEHRGDCITLLVRDYGEGMHPALVPTSSSKTGVGLGGMRERVGQFGGEFKVSRAEPGTLVEATFPLPAKVS